MDLNLISSNEMTDSFQFTSNVATTSGPVQVECRDLYKVNSSGRCAFILHTDDCAVEDGLFNYTTFIFCTLGEALLPLAIIVLALWLILLFISLATTADDFFCPSLQVISKTLRLSDNIAGVTLLAFGNGAPDVFSAIAAIKTMKNGDTGVAMGALLGGGMFITTVIAGTIAIIHPFKSMERPFLRDVIFYIAAVFLTFVVFYNRKITLAWSLVFVGLYVLYVLVVIIGRCVYQHSKQHRTQQADPVLYVDDPYDSDDDLLIPRHDNINSANGDLESIIPQGHSVDDDNPDETDSEDEGRGAMQRLKAILRGRHSTQSMSYRLHSRTASGAIGHACNSPTFCLEQQDDNPFVGEQDQDVSSDDDDLLLDEPQEINSFTAVLKVLCKAINPIDLDDWKSMRWYWRIYEIFKSIPMFLFLLTIPLVDCTTHNHNWNRYLTCLHCITAPVFVTLAVAHQDAWSLRANYFPVVVEVAISGFALAIIVHSTSKNDQPPKFHWMFAYIGFIVALFWIKSIASEIVNLLQTFGIVFDVSSALLGLTVLAWGNSIGDFIADIAMTRQGFPRTGISACFGGPLFNLLLGIGIPFSMHCANNGDVQVDFTIQHLTLIVGVLTSLILSLIVVPMSKFQFTRSYGFALYALYLIFIVFAILVELSVIPNFLPNL